MELTNSTIWANWYKLLNFNKETYLNGKIEESSFDKEKLDLDRDSVGTIVTRDFGISKENCQRAKVLSCDIQRKARQDLRKEVQKIQYEKLVDLYEDEQKRYDLNQVCESKIVARVTIRFRL